MEYWTVKNGDYAATITLYKTLGYLRASGNEVETQKVIDYIYKSLEEETARLDKKFPYRKGESEQ